MSKLYPKILEWIIAIALLTVAYFWVGHRAVSDYKDAQKIEQAEADKRQQAKYDTLAADYETLRTRRESDAKVIVRQVEKVIAGDVVYRNICISDSGMQLANESLAGKASGKPDDTVQTTEQP